MKKFFTVIIFVFFYHSGFSQTWIKKQDFAGTGRAFTGSFSIPSIGKGYVVAGRSTAGGNFTNAWAFDSLTNSWSQIASYPGFSVGPVGFSINGKGYLATGEGGTGANYFSNELYEYDPAFNTWTARAPFPGQHRSSAVAFELGGKGYVGGGVNNTSPTAPQYNNALKDFYAYDPATNTWTQIADCPAAGVNDAAIGFSIGNKGYVGTGGQLVPPPGCCASDPQQDFWEYDPLTNQWIRKADFPGGGRRQASGFSTCNMGFICCGLTKSGTLTNDFWQYNPALDKWTQLATFLGGVRVSASEFVIGNSIFVGNGLSYPTFYADLWEITFPSTIGPGVAAFSSSNPNICIGQTITFTDTSTFNPTNWQWNFPGGIPGTSTAKNPVIQYDTAGTYDVILSAWNGCNSAGKTFTKYVTVSPGGSLTVTADPPSICNGQSSMLTVSGTSSYKWTPATGLTSTTGPAVSASPSVTTTYAVTTSGGSCNSTGQVVVQVNTNTIAGVISALRDTICAGTPGSLTVTGNTGAIQWQSSLNSVDFTNISGATGSPYISIPSQTTYFRIVAGSGNCPDTSSVFKLTVAPSPVAAYTYSESGLKITFNSGSSSGATIYNWDFGDQSPLNTELNPVHTFSTADTFHVCLTVFNGSNCSFTTCYSIGVGTVGAQSIPKQEKWIVYPIPFKDYLYISSGDANSRIESISVFDILGRRVLNNHTDNNTVIPIRLDVTDISEGIYFLKIKTNETNYFQKISKN